MEEIRVLGGLVFGEATFWVLSCLMHYVTERPGQMRTKAPGWLRKVFGDFRKEGTLLTGFMVIQALGYIIIAIALLIALVSDLTRQTGIRLFILWFVLIIPVPFLITDLIPRLFRRKE
jgi:hypothetical protein